MQQIGHFQLVGELGRGGMGVVFKAWDPYSQSHVAIKQLLAAHNPKRLSRFKREVQVLQRLQHPNVIPIRAFGEERGRPYLVMSLIEGKTLEDLVEARGPLPPSMVAEIGRKLASALHAAHELGILHRDVKPDNVLLRTDGDVVLTDFGLAKDVALEESQLTVEGGFMGTPGFVAPEQATGDGKLIGPATDVYGLGATLYYALTGRPPVEGSTLFEIMNNMHKPPTRIRSLRSDVPKDLALLVQRCLKQELSERYRSCGVLERDLDDYLRGTSRFEVQGAATRRRPVPLLVAVVGLLACSALAVGWVALRDPPPSPEGTDVDPPTPEESPLAEEVAAALATAQLAVERGDWDAARAGFDQVLLLDPSSADGLHGLWRALNKLEDPRQVEVLRRAVEADPRPEATVTLAVLYQMQKRADDALVVLRRGLAQSPDDPKLLSTYGTALGIQGKWSEALESLQQAWAQEQTHTTGIALTKCLVSLERYTEALEVVAVAVELDPKPIEGRYLLGFLQYRAGAHAAAASTLSEVWRESGETHIQCVRPLANSLDETGQTQAALSVLNRALEVEPRNSDLLFLRSTVLNTLGRAEDELADLNAVLAFDPDHRAALNNRSLTLFHFERYEQALADAERLTRLEPTSYSAWVQLGACCTQLKARERSRDAYAEAAKLDPEAVGARVGRAQASHHLKDYAAAIADYTWILSREPDNHAMRYNLGLAYASADRRDQARKTMQELVRRTPPDERRHGLAQSWLDEDAQREVNPPD